MSTVTNNIDRITPAGARNRGVCSTYSRALWNVGRRIERVDWPKLIFAIRAARWNDIWVPRSSTTERIYMERYRSTLARPLGETSGFPATAPLFGQPKTSVIARAYIRSRNSHDAERVPRSFVVITIWIARFTTVWTSEKRAGHVRRGKRAHTRTTANLRDGTFVRFSVKARRLPPSNCITIGKILIRWASPTISVPPGTLD